jgi:hypothetical protein
MAAGRLSDDCGGLTLVACPQCGDFASVEWQATADDLVYVKTHCVQRHWFLLPSTLVREHPGNATETRWPLPARDGR